MKKAILLIVIFTSGLFAVDFMTDFSEFTEELDVIFAMDTSGSMYGEIAEVRATISDITFALDSVGSDYKLGSTTFGDGVNIWDFDRTTPGVQPTDDQSIFQIMVDGTGASGGGDWPETSLDAINDAAFNYEWVLGRSRVILMFTDAPYHEDDWASDLEDEELLTYMTESSIPVFISASTSAVDAAEFYVELAEDTGGALYPLSESWVSIFDDILEAADEFFYLSCEMSGIGPDEDLETVTLEGLEGIEGSPRTIDISRFDGVSELVVGWRLEPYGGLMKVDMTQDYEYTIRLTTSEGEYTFSDILNFAVAEGKKSSSTNPIEIEISAYPNPFNGAVRIDATDGANIEVYDSNGKLIEKNLDSNIWHPSGDLASGVYLFKATKDGYSRTEKALYIK
ncbi:MAG: T9SS type A sorting domain-containing protein [Candidatus Zixiibacteriota bacterium]